MGYTEGGSPEGGPDFNSTPQTTADFQRLRDYIEERGNSRKGTLDQMNALVPPEAFDGLQWQTTDGHGTWLYSGGWTRRQTGRLGRAHLTTPVILVASPAWTDLLVVTATSSGGTCTADWSLVMYNALSGADRTTSFRVVCDGVAVEEAYPYNVPVSGGTTGIGGAGSVDSAPGAGSHTWKLQGNASTASSCGVKNATLKISEI